MWIYSTISPKHADMIIDDSATGRDVWKRLTDIFHDNKDARVIQLDNEIRNMAIGNLSVNDYFQEIKSKADRLANLDSPVKDSTLVTYAINGLRCKYREIARIIRHREKLPTFDEVPSMILLEESDVLAISNASSSLHTTSSSATVLVATNMSTAHTNTMSTSGIDQCRNFHVGSWTSSMPCGNNNRSGNVHKVSTSKASTTQVINSPTCALPPMPFVSPVGPYGYVFCQSGMSSNMVPGQQMQHSIQPHTVHSPQALGGSWEDNVEKRRGNDAFVIKEFDSWHKKAYLYTHVGNVDSYHNRAFQKCENLLKENQSIVDAFNKKKNPMRGHDKSETSLSKGMILEVYHFLRDHIEAIRAVTLENDPKNCTLTSPKIQKDDIVKSICLEIGVDVFSLLVDESSDVAKKEQMAIGLRYVDKYGLVKERFFGIVQLRGQGHDGASNMCGEFNGLKALILKENESAYYIHCFAHHDGVGNFFDILSTVTNVVCGSCKRKDIMRESHKERLKKEIAIGETETGKGKNKEVLHFVKEDEGSNYFGRRFIGERNHKSIEADHGIRFSFTLEECTFFCELNGIEMVNIAESHSKSRRNKVTNQHHFEVDIFNTVFDMQNQEFGDRFSELSTELLENMAALSPHNSFIDFNVSKLVKFSEVYPHDFTYMKRLRLPTDLVVHYQIMSNDKDYADLSSISKLASLMVEKNKHTSHHLVYRLYA
ncbi:zinc finger MYM-type protein 1-like protein [Tanacetum coccineum]